MNQGRRLIPRPYGLLLGFLITTVIAKGFAQKKFNLSVKRAQFVVGPLLQKLQQFGVHTKQK